MKVIFTFLVLIFSFLIKGFHSPNGSSNEHSLNASTVHAFHNRAANEFDEFRTSKTVEDLFVSDNDDDELTTFKKKAQFLRSFTNLYDGFVINYIHGFTANNSARQEGFCL